MSMFKAKQFHIGQWVNVWHQQKWKPGVIVKANETHPVVRLVGNGTLRGRVLKRHWGQVRE